MIVGLGGMDVQSKYTHEVIRNIKKSRLIHCVDRIDCTHRIAYAEQCCTTPARGPHAARELISNGPSELAKKIK